MIAYLIHRLLFMILTLFVVATVVFFLIRLIPGSAVDVYITPDANVTQEGMEVLKERFGLDQPAPLQFARWIGAALRGDLGVSNRMHRPVAGLILSRLPVTVELTVLSVLLSISAAIPMGVVAAVHRDTWIDFVTRLLGTVGISVPNFWLATVVILLSSRYLGLSPPPVFVAFWENPVVNMQQMIPASFCVALLLMAVNMRFTRSSMLEILAEDYVRTARAKGLQERVVLYGHCLRNALMPVATTLGIQAGMLVGGVVVVEQIFGFPGIGWLLLNAVYMRDYPVVQGTVLFIALIFVVLNLLVDLTYTWIDPRIRYG